MIIYMTVISRILVSLIAYSISIPTYVTTVEWIVFNQSLHRYYVYMVLFPVHVRLGNEIDIKNH